MSKFSSPFDLYTTLSSLISTSAIYVEQVNLRRQTRLRNILPNKAEYSRTQSKKITYNRTVMSTKP